MGLLTDEMARVFFESGDWQVHLFRKGREISVRGYEPLRPAWAVNGGDAMYHVQFAFDQYARFDELRVTRDGTTVQREAFGDEWAIVPGADWSQDITVNMADA